MPQGCLSLPADHEFLQSYLFIIFICTLYSLRYREGAQSMYVNEQMNWVSAAGFGLKESW